MMLQARSLGDGAGLLPPRLLFNLFLVAVALLASQANSNPVPVPVPVPVPSPQQPPQQQPVLPAGATADNDLAGARINGTIDTANTVNGDPKANPPLTNVPPAKIQEDTGQVAINKPAEAPTQPTLPMRATIFRGVPGPKACRGAPMNVLEFAPGTALQHSQELCYDLPDTAGCGNFVANKADGCEARLFAESGCRMFVNLAVFQPDNRAVGGRWRSMAVRCGVPEPDPATLGAPPLAGMWSKKTSKTKGGKR